MQKNMLQTELIKKIVVPAYNAVAENKVILCALAKTNYRKFYRVPCVHRNQAINKTPEQILMWENVIPISRVYAREIISSVKKPAENTWDILLKSIK